MASPGDVTLCSHVAAGGAGGIAALLVGAPFDTVKVRQQVWKQRALPTLRQCLRQEGLAGLYKGTSPQLVGAVFKGCVRYGAFGVARQLVDREALGVWGAGAAAGCLTGMCMSLVVTPVDRLKTLQQVESGRRVSLHELLRAVGRHGGLYRGFTATLARSMIGNSAAMASYEVCACARSRVRACACVLPSSMCCMQH